MKQFLVVAATAGLLAAALAPAHAELQLKVVDPIHMGVRAKLFPLVPALTQFTNDAAPDSKAQVVKLVSGKKNTADASMDEGDLGPLRSFQFDVDLKNKSGAAGTSTNVGFDKISFLIFGTAGESGPVDLIVHGLLSKIPVNSGLASAWHKINGNASAVASHPLDNNESIFTGYNVGDTFTYEAYLSGAPTVNGSFQTNIGVQSAVPEPASLALLGLGAGPLLAQLRRRKAAQTAQA